ncbi:MAG: hypothetical protein SGPRY_001156 [Prymnesium sp.]
MAARARPWTFGAPLKTAEQKEQKKKRAKHTIALHPWGLAAQYDAFDVPSFEVWASMLMYDESVQGGGERFQRMPHFLLVDGRSASTAHVFKKLYILPNKESPKMSTFVYISKNARAWSGAKGGVVGYNMQHTGKDDDNAKGITSLVGHGESHEVTVSVRPGSKADWLKMISVDIGRYNVQGTAVNQQFSRGTTSGSSNVPQEINGELAMGNQLSVLCGLYYYRGCERPEYNWTVAQAVEGTVYHIRIRLPNPSFTLQNKKLYPHELVNEPVVQQLRGLNTRRPRVRSSAAGTRACLTCTSHRSALASSSWRGRAQIRKQARALHGLPRSLKALWLYPHYMDDCDTLQLVCPSAPGLNLELLAKQEASDAEMRQLRIASSAPGSSVSAAPEESTELADRDVDDPAAREQRPDLPEPHVLRDDDDLLGAGGEAEMMRVDKADVNYGDSAMGVQDTAVAAAMAGVLNDEMQSERDAAIDMDAITRRESLAPGAPIRPGVKRNEHFTSPSAHPWPREDLFDALGTHFNLTSMNDNEVLEYQKESRCKFDKEQPVRVNFGRVRDELMGKLITDRYPVCRKNLRRILCLYFHESDLGPHSCPITLAEKRGGFNYEWPVYRRGKAGFNTMLWRPVFDKEPDKKRAKCFRFDHCQGTPLSP